MSENLPSLEEWRNLYNVMAEVKKMTPWEYMEESDVFGVQNPETGVIGFVSVMGMLGEHLAIAVYPGAKAIYDFWEFSEEAVFPDANPMRLLEIPQLQASFEDRELIEKEDRAVMKQLKLKFRGRQAWPQFRSYRPGLFPWFLEADEARFLTYALQQLLDVAPRYAEDDLLLFPDIDEDDDDERDVYLVRTAEQTADGLVWKDEFVAIDEPDSIEFEVKLSSQLIAQMEQANRVGNIVEVDFFMLPSPLQDETVGERPFFPYMLLMVEADSGMIMGFDMMHVETTLEEMWSQVAHKTMGLLAKANIIPHELHVGSYLLADLLEPLEEVLELDIDIPDELPALDEAKMAMMMQFSQGFG